MRNFTMDGEEGGEGVSSEMGWKEACMCGEQGRRELKMLQVASMGRGVRFGSGREDLVWFRLPSASIPGVTCRRWQRPVVVVLDWMQGSSLDKCFQAVHTHRTGSTILLLFPLAS